MSTQRHMQIASRMEGITEVEGLINGLCEDLGVEFLMEEDVESMDFEGKKPVSLSTSKRTIEFDQLVINADFARAMERLVPNGIRKRWSNETIEKKKLSCSTFMMYLGVKGTFPEVPHHTIYIAQSCGSILDAQLIWLLDMAAKVGFLKTGCVLQELFF